MESGSIGNADYPNCTDVEGHEFRVELGEFICVNCGIQPLHIISPSSPLNNDSDHHE